MRIRFIAIFFLLGFVLAEEGAKFLIIAHPPYVPIVKPLAEWKTKKGVRAKVVPLSEVGSTPAQIQSYIRNAYQNWPMRPEFVLLVGSPSQIPSYNGTTDCYYGDMVGDYKMEISVGRFFATNARECSTMVAKVIAYEKPDLQTIDTLYFLKGTTVVREDQPSDPYYQPDSRLVRSLWENAGYALTESLLNLQGHSSSDVNAAGTGGRMFITYRGQGVGTWWSPFNSVTPANWDNGAKLPVVVAGTCMTIDLSTGGVYGDLFVRAGTPSTLGGVLAYFGTTSSGSHISDRRSACFLGFFTALFQEGEYRLGPATLRGRFWVDSLFHEQTRYQEWNLLGDPELGVWTGVPKMVTVVFDSVIEMVPQVMTVAVLQNGSPVGGVPVCLSMDSTIYAVETTDTQGEAHITVNPGHIGMMDIVVSGRNILPFEGRVRVIASGVPFIVTAGSSLDDYEGNHDGIINPGERFRLTVSLKNVGGRTANGVNGLFRTASGLVRIVDSISAYGTLAPDSTRAGDPFELWVDSLVAEGFVIPATVLVRDEAGDSWNCPIDLTIRAGSLRLSSALFLDSPPGGNSNGKVGQMESGRLQIALINQGGGNLDRVHGIITCLDTNVGVIDSTGFYGRIECGEINRGEVDRFAISSGPNLPRNQPVRFLVRVWGDGGTYRYSDTFSFELPGEEGGTSEPTGPDAYGYWCYDDTDTTSGQAPVYEWHELTPPGPGVVIPVVSDSDAATVTLPLPFTFQYYGIRDSFISICSNGFLALCYTNYRRGYNRPIPDTAGPPWMIAPFWDDLNPDESRNGYGTAYQYYDTLNHRLILEFKDFAHYNQPNIRESFQVVLYDPLYYPTPTGDGEIIFLYQRVALGSSCTVGIEDGTETRGVQYLYNNTYHPTAAYLQANRAIKFTTNPPRGHQTPWLLLREVRASDTLEGNGNGLWEPGERLEVAVFMHNRGDYDAANTIVVLSSEDGDAVVHDSMVILGLIPAGATVSNLTDPFRIEIVSQPSDSILEFRLKVQAIGYSTVGYFSLGISGLTGVEERYAGVSSTGMEKINPSLINRSTVVKYALLRSAEVDLAVFDALGRRVKTLEQGTKSSGAYQVPLSFTGLPQGVYFCRLLVRDGAKEERFTAKVQFVH
ncbi:MAG: C25 family cysteine peptidase [bacterium]